MFDVFMFLSLFPKILKFMQYDNLHLMPDSEVYNYGRPTFAPELGQILRLFSRVELVSEKVY